MSSNKTAPNDTSITAFLDAVPDQQKRLDSYALLDIMKEITNEPPVMWGPSMIGFGSYHYKYDSGREGDMFITGFSPRKTALTVYIISGFKKYDDLMLKLGKNKTGKSCLYIKRLSDVNIDILKELISASFVHIKTKYNS